MEDPIVKVYQGQLRGVNVKSVYGQNYVAFRGVPYGKPPVGDLRFKDSEPPLPWSGIRDATVFGNRCAQHDPILRKIIGTDDCLYLNIYMPTLNPLKQRAVMFWIHGGAFIWGSSDDDIYSADYLIDKDIVLVTINYRLGIFGFLNIDDIEAPGNQGLKDQVLALKWIQQNIAQFGGDPNNVTIFGESAGSGSVHYLTISPLAQGLFHKAILQSGVASNPWTHVNKSPMESVKKLAKILNRDISDVKEFVNYLRTLNALHLVEMVDKIPTATDKIMFINPFLPSIDSKAINPFLTEPIEEAVKRGIKVPSLCGYLEHEGIIIIILSTIHEAYKKINENTNELLVHPNTLNFLKEHKIDPSDVRKYFFDDSDISIENIYKMIDALSAIYFLIGIHDVVEIQLKTPDIPLYLYKLDYEMENSLIKQLMGCNLKGTCHGEDLSYLFYFKIGEILGKRLPEPGSVEYCMIQRFTQMWTDFAKTGNPTPKKTDLIPVKWEPVDSTNTYKCLEITDKLEMGTEMNITNKIIQKQMERHIGIIDKLRVTSHE